MYARAFWSDVAFTEQNAGDALVCGPDSPVLGQGPFTRALVLLDQDDLDIYSVEL